MNAHDIELLYERLRRAENATLAERLAQVEAERDALLRDILALRSARDATGGEAVIVAAWYGPVARGFGSTYAGPRQNTRNRRDGKGVLISARPGFQPRGAMSL